MPLLDHKKAMEQGLISKKQMEKLPPHLVDAIIKSKMKKSKIPKGSHKMSDGTLMKDKDMKKKKKK
tara:strand:- start:3126 stop:3323 length:198 start_codon:yes stop_codon:yes gene_type:complete